MNARSVSVPCDRCGEHPAAGASSSLFSFCASCGLFVCSECWSPSGTGCRMCIDGVGRSAPTATNAVAAPRTRQARARRPRRPGRSPQPVTTLTPRGGSAAAPAPTATRSAGTPRRGEHGGGTATVDAPTRAAAAAAATTVSPELEAVGPGVSEPEPLPRWARRSRPQPISVRWLNTLTEGTPFRILLAALLAIGVTAGAWAVATTNQEPGVTRLVAPSPASASVLPTETPDATGSPRPTPTPPWERRYVVRDGDTLAAIAENVYGDETLWPLILEANEERIEDPEHLRIGTSLLIPNE